MPMPATWRDVLLPGELTEYALATDSDFTGVAGAPGLVWIGVSPCKVPEVRGFFEGYKDVLGPVARRVPAGTNIWNGVRGPLT